MINWSDIKDGYKGFENLAVRYVQDNYDSRFEHTKDTRDGNKDARLVKNEYTLVMGFRCSEKSAEEWWMEAKFSETNEHITRYRLDATLVSAILKGSVGRIIFVTNINVDAQTVNDIRQAIICSTSCKDVDFCTRDYLEFWLYHNPKIRADFFQTHNTELLCLPDLSLIQQIEFFSADKSNLVFRESLRVLDRGGTYIARFAIYTHDQQELKIKAGSYLKGIGSLHPKTFKLEAGINNLEFQFSLAPTFGYRSAKRTEEHSQLPAPTFKLGSLTLISRYNITVGDMAWRNYSIPSQNNLLHQISKYYAAFQRDAETRLLYISGQSGVGKSHVVDRFLQSICKSNTLIFVCEMSENQKYNFDTLVRCIDFIYFPFLPADSVSKDYLDSFRNDQFISKLYYDITCCEHETEELGKLFFRYISEDSHLFPRRLYVNPRLLVIDNIHKANELIINTVYKIAMELSLISSPYMLILSGQQIRHTGFYTELQKTIPVWEHNLCISVEDCLSLLPGSQKNEEIASLFRSDILFSNTIEMLIFTEYIIDHGDVVNNLNSFIVLYHLFFQERIMDAYIGRLFLSATRNDAASDSLCNEIYWNSFGVDGSTIPEGRKLLSCHIAKCDPVTGRLIPYHDIYTNYYRRNYPHHSVFDIPFVEILDESNLDAIREAIEGLHQAFKERRYIFVYYSLEPVYRQAFSHTYKNLFPEDDYYTLYYEFACACAFCSPEHSSQKMFMQLYREIGGCCDRRRRCVKFIMQHYGNLPIAHLNRLTFKGL